VAIDSAQVLVREPKKTDHQGVEPDKVPPVGSLDNLRADIPLDGRNRQIDQKLAAITVKAVLHNGCQHPNQELDRLRIWPLGRGVWRALIEEGTAGIEINKLTKRLGSSGGGFYWFFKDRAQLLEELLAYWARTQRQSRLRK
jgi:hypothetical protein